MTLEHLVANYGSFGLFVGGSALHVVRVPLLALLVLNMPQPSAMVPVNLLGSSSLLPTSGSGKGRFGGLSVTAHCSAARPEETLAARCCNCTTPSLAFSKASNRAAASPSLMAKCCSTPLGHWTLVALCGTLKMRDRRQARQARVVWRLAATRPRPPVAQRPW